MCQLQEAVGEVAEEAVVAPLVRGGAPQRSHLMAGHAQVQYTRPHRRVLHLHPTPTAVPITKRRSSGQAETSRH